jgi:DNA modification methylase
MRPYYQDSHVSIFHGDCREIVPQLGRFDLLLTDPPYGINENSKKVASRENLAAPINYGEFNWDKEPIDQLFLNTLIGNATYSCVFGGNYYTLPPCKGPLIWDKENGKSDFADGEMAWNNYGIALRIKRHLWNGMIRKNREDRFHPTQKPIEIITWAISLCPIDAKHILDPFVGSGTTLRAAKDLNRKAVGIEIEERYCEIAAERMLQEVIEFPK